MLRASFVFLADLYIYIHKTGTGQLDDMIGFELGMNKGDLDNI